MAALVLSTNGMDDLGYLDGTSTPWHGLGQVIPKNAPLDVWLKQSNLNWTAKRTPALFRDENGFLHTSETDILYRSDTNMELGTCSDKYKIVQPEEVINFFEDLVSNMGWHLNVAGCLKGGKRVWAMAKTDAECFIGARDKIDQYLLLATSFDGSLATIAGFTSVRVVCQNTLNMALSGNMSNKIKVSHSTSFIPESVKAQLGLYGETMEIFKEQATEMTKYTMKRDNAMSFILEVLTGEKNVDLDNVSTKSLNTAKNIYELYAGRGRGSTMLSADGTLWGVVNAITEHVDHHARSKSNDVRLQKAWFGSGETMKNEAFNMALAKLAA